MISFDNHPTLDSNIFACNCFAFVSLSSEVDTCFQKNSGNISKKHVGTECGSADNVPLNVSVVDFMEASRMRQTRQLHTSWGALLSTGLADVLAGNSSSLFKSEGELRLETFDFMAGQNECFYTNGCHKNLQFGYCVAELHAAKNQCSIGLFCRNKKFLHKSPYPSGAARHPVGDYSAFGFFVSG